VNQEQRDQAFRAEPAATGNAEVPRTQVDAAGAACDSASLFAALVSAMPQPAILCAHLGRVLVANARCADFLSASPLFIDRAGRLRAWTDAIDAALAALLSGADRRPSILRVPDYGPTGDIILTINWVCGAETASTPGEGPAPLALVCLAHEFRSETAVAEALKRLYGLNDVEAALALAIYGGQRIADFAVRSNLDVMTAHRVRETVLERLAAHRSADVARRVAVVVHAAPAVMAGGQTH
jgi:hypothetical protein